MSRYHGERVCVESMSVLRIRIRKDPYNFGSRDPHQSQKTDPNPDQHQRQISGAMDGGSKPRVCRPMVADLHHLDEEEDPGPHQSEKSDPEPDPQQSEKRDPYPDPDTHHSVSDPQHCCIGMKKNLCLGSRVCTVYSSAREHIFRDRKNRCLLLCSKSSKHRQTAVDMSWPALLLVGASTSWEEEHLTAPDTEAGQRCFTCYPGTP